MRKGVWPKCEDNPVLPFRLDFVGEKCLLRDIMCERTGNRLTITRVRFSEPQRLCQWLLERCQERGVSIHNPAQVISVAKDMRGTLASVRILQQGGVETDCRPSPGKFKLNHC